MPICAKPSRGMTLAELKTLLDRELQTLTTSPDGLNPRSLTHGPSDPAPSSPSDTTSKINVVGMYGGARLEDVSTWPSVSIQPVSSSCWTRFCVRGILGLAGLVMTLSTTLRFIFGLGGASASKTGLQPNLTATGRLNSMTTTIDVATPHEAMTGLLQLFDTSPSTSGPVSVRIERPANTVIDMPVATMSPLADFCAALQFMADNRGTIWQFCNEELATQVMCGETGGALMRLNGDELAFCKSLKESPLGVTVNVPKQVLMNPVAVGGALRPMSEKFVTYGMLHSFMAEVTRNDVGRAFYYMDTVYSGSIPAVMTPDSDSVYAPPSPYPFGLRSVPILDGKHTGLTWLEDAAMLMSEGVSIGLRHAWIRRVAVPIVMAQAHLRKGDKKGVAIDAVKILRQCSNPILRRACIAWIAKRYGLTDTDLKEGDLA
jgi:hypothetical protein